MNHGHRRRRPAVVVVAPTRAGHLERRLSL